MNKIVVIGANSFIARNLIYRLNETQRFELKLYGHSESHIDGLKNYEQVNVVSNAEKIDMNADIIFMFTGRTGTAEGFEKPDEFIDVNEKALLHVLNEYRKQKSHAKLIFPSTRLIYSDNINAHENETGTLKTIYAVNKFVCENYLRIYHEVFNVKYLILRICIPYGTIISGAFSYGTAEFMLKRAKSGENITLYGDGEISRTLTYIGDLCDAMISGAECEECVNDVFNIGGESYTLRDMAELIAGKFGVKVEFVPYPEIAGKIESGHTVFNSEKFEALTGYRPIMKFSDWLEKINPSV